MKHGSCHIVAVLFITWSGIVYDRVYGQEEILTDLIQTAAETGQDPESSEFAEILSDLARHPVNINSATRDEMDAIPLLSPLQSRNLYDYIYTYGEVLSLYELQVIPGFDSSLIRKLAPYIIIRPVSKIPRFTISSLLKQSRHELAVQAEQRLPVSAGYQENLQSGETDVTGYLGSSQRLSFRYTCSWFDKIRFGVAGEKDPGEVLALNRTSRGFDFYAMHLSMEGAGIFRRLVLGHFKALFGQGLTLGTGASLLSGPGFTVSGQPGEGFRPTLSMNENHYLRGAAVSLAFRQFAIHTFISYHPRDARCEVSDSAGEQAWVTSLLTTGYHRTMNEMFTRNAVREMLCGGNISASFSPSQQLGFKIGFTTAYTSYSLPIEPGDEPYRRYAFRGETNLNAGVDFRILFRGLFLAGECAISHNGGRAAIISGTYQPDPRFSVRAIYRNYQPNYQALHAQSFGNNSVNANERGLFLQMSVSLLPRLTVRAYSDLCRYPWVRYRVSAPSWATAWGVEGEWNVAAGCRMVLRIGERRSEINAGDNGMPIEQTEEQRSAGIRYSVDFEPFPSISMRTRAETRTGGPITGNQPRGYLVSQQIAFRPLNRRLSLAAMFSVFDIPDYETRIYVYEPDVRYGFSVPSYQDSGLRTCLAVRFALFRFLDLDFRGGITWYKGKVTTGNGNDETDGPTRGDITVQFLFRM